MAAMAAAGADVIELGMPFSDPMADGPVIQKASERALARGIGMAQVLAAVREFRADDQVRPSSSWATPIPIERYGSERFADDAKATPVSTACWWSTIRRKNARTSRPC